MYIWQNEHWPDFLWDSEKLSGPLAEARHIQGRLLGSLEGLGFRLREEASLDTLTQDVVKSSEIEGERLDPKTVRSSIARRLGIDIGAIAPMDRNVEGVVEMILDATQKYKEPLTAERLFGWHAALFPTGRSGMHKIRVGSWRDDGHGPMQVVSGPIGREKIHYTAPPAERLDDDMAKFLAWFESENSMDGVLKAGLSHLWFVAIHPFDDGNGRIARAIADMALARAERSSMRFYSMSAQMRLERDDYYKILEGTHKGTLDVTDWLAWFIECLSRAVIRSRETLSAVSFKAAFWAKNASHPLNERQIKVLNLMLDGFRGKLTSSKYAKITKTSQDTAARDIAALIEFDILRKGPAGGRSTSYDLTETPKSETDDAAEGFRP